MSAGGMPKGRQALLDLGVQAPDLVDTGTVDWNDTVYGPPDGRQKPAVSFAEQAGSCWAEVDGTPELRAFPMRSSLVAMVCCLTHDEKMPRTVSSEALGLHHGSLVSCRWHCCSTGMRSAAHSSSAL